MTLSFWKHLAKFAAKNIGICLLVVLVLTLYEVFTGWPSWHLVIALLIAFTVGEAYEQYRKERKGP